MDSGLTHPELEPIAGTAERSVEVLSTTVRIHDLRMDRPTVAAYLERISPEKQELAGVLAGSRQAKGSLDVLIFRLDVRVLVDALTAVVTRGIRVRALTASTNKGGAKRLRELEMVLLQGGVTVSRTANDLVRYHGKL